MKRLNKKQKIALDKMIARLIRKFCAPGVTAR
jgi:hypothetical protein